MTKKFDFFSKSHENDLKQHKIQRFCQKKLYFFKIWYIQIENFAFKNFQGPTIMIFFEKITMQVQGPVLSRTDCWNPAVWKRSNKLLDVLGVGRFSPKCCYFQKTNLLRGHYNWLSQTQRLIIMSLTGYFRKIIVSYRISLKKYFWF